jgi:hypothetical protein
MISTMIEIIEIECYFVVLMLQSFETTGPPPPGHSGEFNTDQVLKNINSPAPGANCSVKTPVQPGFSIPTVNYKYKTNSASCMHLSYRSSATSVKYSRSVFDYCI